MTCHINLVIDSPVGVYYRQVDTGPRWGTHGKEYHMTEFEKMQAGLLYDPGDEEIVRVQGPLLDKLWAFNQLKPSDMEAKEAYMKEVFAECGENVYLELPFHANFGGAHAHFGSNIYANFNLTLVDDADIYIGDHVMIGPNVTIVTATHPLDGDLRARGLQYNRPVHIGKNVWIGANAVVLPGVTIGDNAVIGAGSVVTHDIPENVVAVGVPCRVLRKIQEGEDRHLLAE